MTLRLFVLRVIVTLTALTGLNYLTWRWLYSINFDNWYIAIPLVVAETFSILDMLLFGFGIWRLRERPPPPDPAPDLTVDVLITTYDEPIDLVMHSARAALAISYPHRTWILDDGNRPEMRAAAQAEGIGWIARSSEWEGKPRHAKAGNLNNALVQTDGEFLLILDADQVADPRILDATLGYFQDEQMGLVQTQQYFGNVTQSDPLGSQAPLFYGPIQQSKDGWNAAFFCGSNAIIRREALVQIGVSRYAGEIALRVYHALYYGRSVLKKARKQVPASEPAVREALVEVEGLLKQARDSLTEGEALFDVTYTFQRKVDAVRRRMIDADLDLMAADLAEIAAMEEAEEGSHSSLDENQDTLRRLADREWSPLGAIESVTRLVDSVDVDRGDEAQAVMPMATISVTEDMATCMRMHGLGWKSAYHDERLATGLAPEDLGTMLTQRLRWAQGTMQVMFRENPLSQRRLSWPQRLMYFSTMWSYLSGFAVLAYLAAPVLYLCFGILPVKALSSDFFLRLIPFLVLNQLMFIVVAKGRKTWRGMQYSLALFPTWIRAFTSAFGNVYLGRTLDFAVTPKDKVNSGGPPWHLIRPQLVVMVALVLAVFVGTYRVLTGQAEPTPVIFNFAWVALDLALLSIIIRAALYRGFDPAEPPCVTTGSVPITDPQGAS